MKILIGSTNIAKRERFRSLLEGTKAEILMPGDIGITGKPPEETGNTPEENARIKALHYGKLFSTVICNDSGLYFKELPIDDVRQPGLNIRTPMGKPRLKDDEMISYYTDLIHSLGERVEAYYLDGVAVLRDSQIHTFMDIEYAQKNSFYMVETCSGKIRAGWPLDSLSIDKRTGRYFTEHSHNIPDEDNVMKDEYGARLKRFLTKSLGL